MAVRKQYNFLAINEYRNCNPNGGTDKEGIPRILSDKLCMVTSGCFKRYLRDYVEYKYPNSILCVKREESPDYQAMKSRLYANDDIREAAIRGDVRTVKNLATERYFDVRAFGLLVTREKGAANNRYENDIHLDGYGVIGPLTFQPGFTAYPPVLIKTGIATSFNRNNDTIVPESSALGRRYFIRHGLIPFFGGISPQNAQTTGFSEEDVEIVKDALINMLKGRTSDARPAGSCTVRAVVCWEQEPGSDTVSEATLQDSVIITKKDGIDEPRSVKDYDITIDSKLRDITDIIYDDGANIEFV